MHPIQVRTDPAITAEAATWEPLQFRPLRVTLVLENEVGHHDPLHLDSLLAHAVVMKATDGQGLPPNQSPIPYWLPVPLVQVWADAHGLPLWASTDFAPMGLHDLDHATVQRLQMPPALVQRTKRGHAYSTPTRKGPTRLSQESFPTTLAETWVADCYGDERLLAHLLPYLGSHIGKKRAVGYGTIRTWLIEPIPAFSFVTADHRLRRPIPIEALATTTAWSLAAQTVMAGWTSPYYPRVLGSLTLCVPPGTVIDPDLLPTVTAPSPTDGTDS